jgi:peptidyl-prolyl cis-trans isomerase C
MLINGERVPDELIEAEFTRLRTSRSTSLESAPVSEPQLRLMAACAVVDRILIRQHADKDQRPIDPALIDAEMSAGMRVNGCRAGINEPAMRRAAEQQLRIKRAMDELAGDFARPTTDEVMTLYHSWKAHVAVTEKACAAHVIVHINQGRGEAEARAIIERAEAELQAGASFAEVAERYSDCKGNGGDLGEFERGKMVEEFDNAVFALKPGERSSIFRTPFGLHIAELRNIEKAGVHEPGVLQREIEAYLIAKRRQEAMEAGLEKLRDAAEITRELDRPQNTMARPTKR